MAELGAFEIAAGLGLFIILAASLVFLSPSSKLETPRHITASSLSLAVCVPGIAKAFQVESYGFVLGLFSLLVALAVCSAAHFRFRLSYLNQSYPSQSRLIVAGWGIFLGFSASLAVLSAVNNSVPATKFLLWSVALAAAWAIRFDRGLLNSSVTQVWRYVAIAQLVLAPYLWRRANGSDDLPLQYIGPLQELLGIDSRYSGFFFEPVGLGSWAAIGFSLALINRRPDKVLAAACILLAFMSFSRSSIALILVAAAVYGAQNSRSVLKVTAMATVGLLGGIAVAQSVDRDDNAATLTERVDLWNTAVELWRESPVFGLGFNAGQDAATRGVLPEWGAQVHSLFFQVLFTQGLVGVVMYGCCLLVLVLIASRSREAGLMLVGLVLMNYASSNALMHELNYGTLFIILVISAGEELDRSPSDVEGEVVEGPRGSCQGRSP